MPSLDRPVGEWNPSEFHHLCKRIVFVLLCLLECSIVSVDSLEALVVGSPAM